MDKGLSPWPQMLDEEIWAPVLFSDFFCDFPNHFRHFNAKARAEKPTRRSRGRVAFGNVYQS